jgi:hypothetical protein
MRSHSYKHFQYHTKKHYDNHTHNSARAPKTFFIINILYLHAHKLVIEHAKTKTLKHYFRTYDLHTRKHTPSHYTFETFPLKHTISL